MVVQGGPAVQYVRWPRGALGAAASIKGVTLDALSPLDGRYRARLEPYAEAFSETALMRARLAVEVEWLLLLGEEPGVEDLEPFSEEATAWLRRLARDFSIPEAQEVKAIEQRINHDVKAVEYFLKGRLAEAGLASRAEFVHFGATSEDINNLAYSLMVTRGLKEVWLVEAERLKDDVAAAARAFAGLPMPGRTHGQPASPTTLGKELAVFVHRWSRQLGQLARHRLQAKFNGAVGTYAAFVVAYPEVDWPSLSRRFVEGLGFEWNPLTTQIEPHDSLAEVLHGLVRYNCILVDFCRDMWDYTSRDYLKQVPVAGEVGSSTMPHKVNPIDFENAEANAGLSNAVCEHLATKLTASRMQRDLSDSSALRNLGVAFGHSGLAVSSARRGFSKAEPDPSAMRAELDAHWEVLAEALQTVMRRYGLPEPYEQLKELTRGREVGPEQLKEFLCQLDLPEQALATLLALEPARYVGLAESLVGLACPHRPD